MTCESYSVIHFTRNNYPILVSKHEVEKKNKQKKRKKKEKTKNKKRKKKPNKTKTKKNLCLYKVVQGVCILLVYAYFSELVIIYNLSYKFYNVDNKHTYS